MVVAAVFVTICILLGDVAAQSSKPNIVFIMADDLGFNDVSYHGFGEIQTPNIDDLAQNGVRLENYYVGPTCGPTRAQFLSGKYAIHLGLHDSNTASCTREAVPLTDKTIADELKRVGYATHLIGKWHAGFHTANHLPTSRGFDTFRGYLKASSDHFYHDSLYQGEPRARYLDYLNNTEPYRGDEEVYSTTAFTNRAKELISNHDTDTPMFMYLSYQAPHTPIEYPEDTVLDSTIESTDRKRYAAMVTLLDAGVGEVVSELKARGMYDNTVIIFSSDNGGSGGNGASNYPLRGHKGSYYQGGVKAVGFVSTPLLSESQKGKEINDLIHVTDWLPTMLSIAGDSIGSLSIDGLNQWNTIQAGASSSRMEVLLNIGRTSRGTRRSTFNENTLGVMIDGPWKIMTGSHSKPDLYPNPSDDYDAWDDARAQRASRSTATMLFNLLDDPTESNDLSVSNPTKKEELLAKLRAYQRTMLPAITATSEQTQQDFEACNPANHNSVWGPWTT